MGGSPAAPHLRPSRHHVLVSCVDTYVGHALAHYLATELQRHPGMLKKHWRVRILCHSLEGMQDLLAMDVDVQQIDYSNLMVLKAHMNHVKCAIIVPDMTENRVVNACNVIDAASQHGVKCMQMVSLIGCDYADESTPMGEYFTVEQHLRSVYAYGRWCVFRLPMLQQVFYFWSRMVGQDRCVGMPISLELRFTTIGIQDACGAIATALLSPRKQDTNHHDKDYEDYGDLLDIPDTAVKRIYDLTGACAYSGPDVACALNQVAGGDEADITFKKLDEESVRAYLQSLGQLQPGLHELSRRRDPLRPDPRRTLVPGAIDLMMDWFRVANSSMQMGIVKDDSRDLIGHQPTDLSQFFIHNEDQFRFMDDEND